MPSLPPPHIFVADNASYAQAVEVLTSLGLVSGDGDGTYRPADAVKRSEMAKLIVVALGYGDFAAAQKATKFSDVPASHWASGYISFASDLGIIEGVGAGKFNPDVTVSFDEAITMLVRALGYADDKLPGSWPTDMVVKAMDLGIITKTQVGSAGADRGSVAEMLYKTLAQKEATWSAVTGSYSLGNTLLVGLGYIENPAALVKADTSDALLKGHIGEYGVAYTDKTTGKAVAFVPSSVELAGTVKSVSGKTVFTVGTTNYEFKSADVLKLGEGVNAEWVALTNGVAAAGGSAELGVNEVRVLDVKLEAGKIAQVYAVGAWINPTTVLAGKTEAANLVKTDLKSAATFAGQALPMATDGKSVDASKIVLNGVASLAEIKENSVVTYYKGSNNLITRMDVSNTIVVGQITKTAGSPVKYTINGVDYEAVSATVTEIAATLTTETLALKLTGSFYLDAAGKIFAYKAVDTSIAAVNYALITEDAIQATSAAAGGVYGGASAYKPAQIQLLLADGTQVVYSINKDKLATIWTELGYTNDSAVASSPAKGTASKVDTLVMYTLNEAGEIVALDVVDVTSGNKTMSAAGIMDGKLVSSSAVVFVKTAKLVDNDSVLGTDDATDKYAVTTLANLNASMTGIRYAVDANKNIVVLVVSADDVKVNQVTNYGFVTGAVSNILVGDKYAQEVVAVINGVAGTYQTATSTSAVSTLNGLNKALLYSVTLKDGKVDSMTQADLDAVVGSDWTTVVAGVSGNLVNVGTAAAPAYKNVAGATVYVATGTSTAFGSWSVGSMDDVVANAKIVLAAKDDTKLASGVDADVIFVVPAGVAAPAVLPFN